MKYKIIGLALCISGCVTVMPPKEFIAYSGEALPIEQVASIAVDGNVKGVSVFFIDGYEIPMFINGNPMPNWRGAHVLPGKHILTVSGNTKMLGGYMSSYRGKIEVEAKAGHTYIPYFELNEKKEVVFKILDAGLNYNQSCLIGTYPDHTKERKNAKNCL